ncbi:hypothetical protein KM043_012421 [Ampulex compressa]|nr:hypothetical protein KM043_012421 [Ampulex compressa]
MHTYMPRQGTQAHRMSDSTVAGTCVREMRNGSDDRSRLPGGLSLTYRFASVAQSGRSLPHERTNLCRGKTAGSVAASSDSQSISARNDSRGQADGMARQQTADRNIPHLRDIFGFGSKWENSRIPTEEKAPGHDSAISVGSTSGEEESPKNSKKKKSRRRDNSKTLTESDVKHLERHLSMKKTIRKKIMRDLQQAFVEDPNEFRVDDIPPEQLKAEINIQSLSFGTPSQKQGRTRGNAESTFLDMLRSGGGLEKNGTDGDRDSGHGGSPTRETPNAQDTDDESSYTYDTPVATPSKKSGNFWRRFTMKNRNKR